LAKKWRFSQNPMLWSKFCINSFVLSQKRYIFYRNFLRKYLKIITSVPGSNPTVVKQLDSLELTKRII
jgi:hypothetical protein